MTGQEFRALRIKAGLTFKAAAEELGCHTSTIYRWEQGAFPIPKLAAVRIAQLAQEKEHQP